VTPEAAQDGNIGRITDGDLIAIDVASGRLSLHVDDAVLAQRPCACVPHSPATVGRGLFQASRALVSNAEAGGSTLFSELETPIMADATLAHA